MISIETLVFNIFEENTYILHDETKECIIIDPGCYKEEEENYFQEFIKNKSLKPVALLNTHCHIDHILGNYFIKNTFGIPLHIPVNEVNNLNSVKNYGSFYGFTHYKETKADHLIEAGQTITFGNSELKALYVPGHTEGHMVFVNENERICIGGDVLFNGSIGRTDLPGGNFETIIKSIHDTLFTLHNDTIVYPGHGPTTTIGAEKKTNPFCAIQ
jgi:glyoxylase-like metal-dependent hydrolase (beta-lactamase superfamily II)